MQEGRYKLTNQQNNIYLLDVMYKDSGINNIGSWLEFDEEIDIEIMKKVANIIVKKNDCYRLRINLEDTHPYQYVEEYKEFDVEEMYVKNTEELERRIKAARFDLSKDLPFKFAVFKYPNGKGGFVAIVHHLAGDAWTMNLIISQIVTFYYDLKNNIEIGEENYPSYINYILSQEEFDKTDRKEKNQKYWENIFEKPFDMLSFKDKSNISIDSIRKEYMLDRDLLKSVRKFCEYNNISEYIFMLAVYTIYLGRIKKINRFVIGNPILNRANAREKETSGLFMSTNPFLVDIDQNASFLSFAKKLQQDQMNMYRHLKYDYKELVKYINERNNNYENIYDVVFSYQNAKVDKENNHYNTKSRWVENNKQVESLMIHFKDTDDTGDILFVYDYLKDVFTKEEIALMHKRIEYIVFQVLENRFIKYIDIVPDKEKEILLCEYNDTYYEYNRNETIVSVFERVCIENYDKTALVFENEKVTFRQLNKKANQLARALKNIGIQAGDIVAVVDSRSIEMIISMLAILKIGAGYVPIDIEYPKERIEYIIKNANCKVCITKKEHSNKFSTKGKKIFSDDEMIYTLLGENIFTYIPSSSIAYMIYTSGSTGNPKGVMITHNNVINFINGVTNEINFINKTIVSVTTISFDIFVLESWLALTKGCTVVIANEQEQNIPILLNRLCLENNVNMIQTTPSRMKLLMSDNQSIKFLANMTDIMIGGENVPYALVQDLKKITNANIYNMYGPTETTVWSTIKNLTKDDKITIGKPIANTGIYIFDDYMNLCPINIEGNIYIGGDGLSAGYYNNIDLTNEKFIHNPLVKNQYIYMTGDIGKWNNEGNLVCLGRNDFQVKLHGHRIELGEIENTILKFEDVKEASVLCVNNESLCAYFTSRVEISIHDLKKHLAEKLPLYMVPTKVIQIDDMPKTPNGKIDKNALKNIRIEEKSSEKNHVLPKNEIEKKICIFVSRILNKECNNVEENILSFGMDSLSVIDLCNRIIKEYNVNITVKDIFNLRTISAISNQVEGMLSQKSSNVKQKVVKVDKQKLYRATTAQTRIYFASQMKKDSIVYNMPYGMVLEGQFNIYDFKKAINEIIKRQISLQISFEMHDGVLYQKINNVSELNIEVEKIKDSEVEKKYRKFIQAFDFSKAPLMRIKILQISQTKHVVLFDMHHIISDGMSLHILANEISQIYEGQEVEVSQLSFVDYSQNEVEMLEEEKFNKETQYWLKEFSSIPEPLDMPYDYKKEATDIYIGNKIQNTIQSELYEKIKLFAQENDVTPNIVLLSIYYILIARYTKNSDVVVGLPIAKRDNVNLQNSIGLYVNELPVRINVDEEVEFIEFLRIVKEKFLNVLDNSNYPNGQILQLLKKENINVGNNLFDTMFIFQNKGIPTLNLSNIKVTPYVLDSGISKYNFSMEILDQNNRYDINLEYATELFKSETIKNFLNHYINILNEVLINKKCKVQTIQMLGEEEKNKLIYQFNDTQYNIDTTKTIHKMISERASVAKNEIALVFENEKLTYEELEQKTNSLAKALKEKGVQRNDVVGIMVPRSLEMLVGIIAVLKSGASYMPVDISYPQDRIEYMIENSNAKFVLVLEDNFGNQDKYINISLKKKDLYVDVNANFENINDGEDVAYLIYTSGSTGKPKGVMVKHKGITNLVEYSNNNIEFFKENIKRNIVSVTTMSFDIFVFETLLALQKGLTVVIANEEEQRIPKKLNELIEKNDIEIIQTTPSRMQMLVDYKDEMSGLRRLKFVVLIGEPFKDSLLKDIVQINPNITSYNTYGPTETTVFSTATVVNVNKKINIGKPIYNTQVYILDTNKRLVPIGQVGELYIGGEGVSKGYINNEELTNQKFIKNPYLKDDVIYQTGDLARWTNDGQVECLGRTDSQVKIRGLRIELEEIENIILKNNMINQVVVLEKTDAQNRQYLSAYFTANQQVDVNKIRKTLTSNLPQYMIPTHIEQLDEFVYTPNGKIDKKPLKNKQDTIKGNKEKIIAPNNKTQERILKVYKEILQIDSIGIEDNFFDLGGDSILAMRLQISLLKEGIEVSYGDIFNFPTVELLEQKVSTTMTVKPREEKISIPINKYDSVLNNVTLEEKINKNKFKGVILTGATGYVGIHLLANLLDMKVKKIYCLVRAKDNKSGYERLKEKLNFYFSTKYDKYINKEVIIIESDIIKNGIVFSEEMYKKVEKTDVIFINALANVSHYGEEKEFYNANVETVKKIVEFCRKCNKKLFHISTISVSGNALADQTYIGNDINGQVTFKESNLYIKQPLNNIYIKTKFMAEQVMLDNIMHGLDGYILRVGNVMGRYSDGHFQQNADENAYVNRLRAIYNLGAMPDYILGGYLEFTPVDCLSKAILKIALYNNDKNRVFHLFNNKHMPISDFINICEKLYKKIDILSEDNFNKKLYEMLKSDSYSISFILNDLNKDKKLQYESNIKIDAEFTNRYLRKIDFEWPEINEEYIKKFFDYLFDIGFFRKE